MEVSQPYPAGLPWIETKLELEALTTAQYVDWLSWLTGQKEGYWLTYPGIEIEPNLGVSALINGGMLSVGPFLPPLQNALQRLETLEKIRNAGGLHWRYLPKQSAEYAHAVLGLNLPNVALQHKEFLPLFVGALTAIPWPLPHAQQFKNPRSITKALPTLQVSDGAMEPHLPLLTGDLGNPLADSPVVAAVSKDLEKSGRTIHTFVGVSGVGKTKAAFDLARKYFAIYLEFNSRFRDHLRDDYSFAGNIADIIHQSPIGYLKTVTYQIVLLATARLVALILMKIKYPDMTPEQWLLMQINGNYDLRLPLLTSIRETLQQFFPEVHDLMDICKLAEAIINQKVIIVCDEAQQLLQTGERKFPINSNDLEITRSLFHRTIYDLMPLASMVVAGTALSIGDVEDLVASVHNKPHGEQKVVVYRHFEFPYITTVEDCSNIIHRLFDVNLNARQVKFILDRLAGRARSIVVLAYIAATNEAFFQKEGESNEDILMRLVEMFHDYNAYNSHVHIFSPGIPVSSTTYTNVARLYNQLSGAGLAHLVACQHFRRSIDVSYQTNFLTNGLAGVERDGKLYKIAEPIVIRTILHVFKEKKAQVSQLYLAGQFEKIEEAIVLELMSLQKRYNQLSIPDVQSMTGKFCASTCKIGETISYLKEMDPESTVLKPENVEGPEIVYFSSPILWIFSCKTRENSEPVEGHRIIEGYDTTDILRFAHVDVEQKDLQETFPSDEKEIVKILNKYAVQQLESQFGAKKKANKGLLVNWIIENIKPKDIEIGLAKLSTKADEKIQRSIAIRQELLAQVTTLFNEGILQRIVRVHIILPYKPSGIVPPAVTVTEVNGVKIPTTVLDVTFDNIKSIGLFTDRFIRDIMAIITPRLEGASSSHTNIVISNHVTPGVTVEDPIQVKASSAKKRKRPDSKTAEPPPKKKK